MSAAAEWPYATWGMKADEIVAASGGVARKVEGDEQQECSGDDFTTLAVAPLEIAPFVFDVSFRAARDGSDLATIRLELADPDQYDALRDELVAQHGTGEDLPPESDGMIVGVRWSNPRETITLLQLTWPMDLGIDVALDYEPPAPSKP